MPPLTIFPAYRQDCILLGRDNCVSPLDRGHICLLGMALWNQCVYAQVTFYLDIVVHMIYSISQVYQQYISPSYRESCAWAHNSN
jgi:hypothetical protein